MRIPLTVGAAVLVAGTMIGGGALLAPRADAQAAPVRPAAFAACAICHKTGPTDTSTMGPSLWKIGGRRAGAATFNYSPAMKGSNIVWNKQTLIAFLTDPKKVIPGNRMAYMGQKNPKTAAEIADYLMKLK
jgi:cytochrome c